MVKKGESFEQKTEATTQYELHQSEKSKITQYWKKIKRKSLSHKTC